VSSLNLEEVKIFVGDLIRWKNIGTSYRTRHPDGWFMHHEWVHGVVCDILTSPLPEMEDWTFQKDRVEKVLKIFTTGGEIKLVDQDTISVIYEAEVVGRHNRKTENLADASNFAAIKVRKTRME